MAGEQAVAVDSPDNSFRMVLDELNGDEYQGLTRKHKRDLRAFIEAAQADGKITLEEVIDFYVLTDSMEESNDCDLTVSSMKGATVCLLENGIEPTPARIRALGLWVESVANAAPEEE